MLPSVLENGNAPPQIKPTGATELWMPGLCSRLDQIAATRRTLYYFQLRTPQVMTAKLFSTAVILPEPFLS